MLSAVSGALQGTACHSYSHMSGLRRVNPASGISVYIGAMAQACGPTAGTVVSPPFQHLVAAPHHYFQ
jgi:hypothetical protein